MLKYSLSLLFLSAFLAGCNIGGGNDALKKEIAALKAQLEKATDPETVSKLQNELKQKQLAELGEKDEEITALITELEKTKTKKDCETKAAQIKKKEKEIDEIVNATLLPLFGRVPYDPGSCGENGYVASDEEELAKTSIPQPKGSVSPTDVP